jgi:hypothetical protein
MEITKERFSIILFIIMILVVFLKEFYTDIYYTQKTSCTNMKIDKEIKNIIAKKETSLTNKMIDACKSGLLRGCVAGSLTGGVVGGIGGGVVYGISNSIVTYITYSND